MDIAHPHTIKKFELIEAYVKEWSQKLLNNPKCNGIVFIDCMCNSGVYISEDGNTIFGTPIRVANYLASIMKNYPNKKAYLYFNDLSFEKIEELNTHIPSNTSNFIVFTSVLDGNQLLREIKLEDSKLSYLLVYDPYQATIDWFALMPFIQNWGDVIVNHMVSDTIRAVSQVKRPSAKEKYEHTYLSSIQELANFKSDRDAFEMKVQQIMTILRGGRGNRRYYIASFPFFNTCNAVVYNLLLGTGSLEGFTTFKKVAWKIFGGKSSGKKTYESEGQLMINTDYMTTTTTPADENCYFPKDIANYLHHMFFGQENVPLADVWAALEEHPVFPSEGFRPEIKQCLQTTFGDKIAQSTISFTGTK
jgi:three-Cys-motif partner protein